MTEKKKFEIGKTNRSRLTELLKLMEETPEISPWGDEFLLIYDELKEINSTLSCACMQVRSLHLKLIDVGIMRKE